MEWLVALLVLGLALAILAYPLYVARPREITVSASTLDDLVAQRDGIYSMLRDLDLDFELGKLDRQDYQATRTRYLARAARVLEQLDLLRGAGAAEELSQDIERQVRALRAAQTAEAAAADAAQTAQAACPNCGSPYAEGDLFCAKCGHALPKSMS